MAKIRIEMTDEQLLTLAASIAICALEGLRTHMKPHAAIPSRIKKVQESIGSLASLNGCKLPEEMLVLGVRAWGHTMNYVSNNIKNATSAEAQQ